MITECTEVADSLHADLSAIRSFEDARNQVRAAMGPPEQVGWVLFDNIASALLARANSQHSPRSQQMTKLSDTQLVILSAAAQRAERIALPLPKSLRGGAATKVVATMIANGLLEEVDADLRKGEPVWRSTGDGHGTTLVATDAGLAAIGVEPNGAHEEDKAIENEAAPKTRTQREGTKQATLIEMLRAPEGATIGEIVAATGWLAHTARGAMAGALKKRLGLTITSEKEERGRVYRIV
jgi:hypothetical protein